MEFASNFLQRTSHINAGSRSLLNYAMITLAASIMLTTASAQTFAEWFSQKKTQKKYLLQQIAALQLYSTYLRQGYSIARQGLGGISLALKAEYDLHNTYYQRFKKVVITTDPRINEILCWQQSILNQMVTLAGSMRMVKSDLAYINRVKSALLTDCNKQMDQLTLTVTSSNVQMSDKQRLDQLNNIHAEMKENYSFAILFSETIWAYSREKNDELKDISTLRRLVGKH